MAAWTLEAMGAHRRAVVWGYYTQQAKARAQGGSVWLRRLGRVLTSIKVTKDRSTHGDAPWMPATSRQSSVKNALSGSARHMEDMARENMTS